VQVASWGAYLLSRDILAMSFAPRDSHEAQVQFALERGVPAMIGVLASNRLTYPARSFDMAHCSRCLIPWQLYGTHARRTSSASVVVQTHGPVQQMITHRMSVRRAHILQTGCT
jgi:hypothetical protein